MPHPPLPCVEHNKSSVAEGNVVKRELSDPRFLKDLHELCHKYKEIVSGLTSVTEEFAKQVHTDGENNVGSAHVSNQSAACSFPESQGHSYEVADSTPRCSSQGTVCIQQRQSKTHVESDDFEASLFLTSQSFEIGVGNQWLLKPEWEGGDAPMEEVEKSPSLKMRMAMASRHKASILQTGKLQRTDSFPALVSVSFAEFWFCTAASPASWKRIAWELFGCVLICYDMVVVPLVQAFDPPSNFVLSAMDWVTRLFWTFNIPIVLTTGFIANDKLHMQPSIIFMNYCKTWLALDAITILPDWLIVVLSTAHDDQEHRTGSYMKLFRILRLLRLARLMRLPKLRAARTLVYAMIDSEKISIALEIWFNVLTLMIANHFIACMWYAVGKAQHGNSWLKEHKYSRDRIAWNYQYLLAYHWSLTQFQSSMHVQPQSASERFFAICVLLLSVVGFSYLVGSISSSLARLRAMDEKRVTGFWTLRKYLKQKKVPHDLSVRLESYAQTRFDYQQKHMEQSDVELLSLLSDNLKSELHGALHGPFLRIHPVFRRLYLDSRLIAQKLALASISQLSLAPLDTFFTAGEEATHMCILAAGMMTYERMHFDHPENVDAELDWIAEPVLWVNNWCHLGDLKAVASSDLLQVEPTKLFNTVHLNPVAFMVVREYAKRYREWLNSIGEHDLSDISKGDLVGETLAQFVQDPGAHKQRRVSIPSMRPSIGGVLSRLQQSHGLRPSWHSSSR